MGLQQMMKKSKNTLETTDWIKCTICGEEWSKIGKVCPDCIKIRQSKEYEQILEEQRRKEKTFENFRVTQNNNVAYKAAEEFFNDDRGLYFYGNVGRGKSHLAKACNNRLRDEGKNVVFMIIPDLLVKIRKTYAHVDANDTTERELIDKCVNADYLILDELREKTDFCMSILFLILNGRENRNNSKIIITSNYDTKEIAKAEDRVASRILGMCGKSNVIEVRGKDWRVKD